MKVFAALLAVAGVLVPVAVAVTDEAQVASCDPGPVMAGSGSPKWRQESTVAGPLGMRRNPLQEMAPYSPRRPDLMVTKAPVLVEGHKVVTLSVPPRLVGRVFLYYGFREGPDGQRSTSFHDSPGSSTIEFQPCAGKPRTVWPGGIRVKGRKSVQLTVTVEGRPDSIPLRLGRPKPFER